MTNHSSASGKIILSGEYAVLFGYEGIAVPAPLEMTVTFEEDSSCNNVKIIWPNHKSQITNHWNAYCKNIIQLCGSFTGTLTIENKIPLGKGLGSSTALVIAVCKCFLGDECEKKAKEIEDIVNPGNSGIDFAVIWHNKPILFSKDKPYQLIDILMNTPLKDALLIDTGAPDQQTPELIAWVTERKEELSQALETIGNCSKKLQQKEEISDVIREHNAAQQSLGIVTDKAKELITKIEQAGGAAKVLGAGSRTGGCGMILALRVDASVIPKQYPVTRL